MRHVERLNRTRTGLMKRNNYWRKKETGEYSLIRWWKHQWMIMTIYTVVIKLRKTGKIIISSAILLLKNKVGTEMGVLEMEK
jgi:hypothetical protein